MGRKSSQKKKSETSVQDTPESAESAALTKRRRALILRFACASAARLYRGVEPQPDLRPDRAAFG